MSLSLTSIDFEGVDPAKLEDASLLSALLVTVANAVSLNPVERPTIARSALGIAAAVVGPGGHIVLHTRPHQGLCIVDLVVPESAGRSPDRAVEILERRLGARRTSIDTHLRGSA